MAASVKPSEKQRDDAALWLVRRTGRPISQAEEMEFADWLNADPRHRIAYDDVKDLWVHLEAPANRLAERSYSSTQPRVSSRLRKVGLFAPVIAVAALLLVWFVDPSVIQNWQADAVTARGEQKTFDLPDGSKLHAAADTALKFDFAGGKRQVTLLRGEAYFEVRQGLANNFTVDLGWHRINVVGTKFDTNRLSDSTIVTVGEGTVQLVGQGSAPLRLDQGRRVVVGAGRPAMVEPANIDAALAWMSRRLVFQNESLHDVAIILQRQVKGRLLVLGKLADAKVSGTFPMDDIQGSVDTIAAATGAKVARVTTWLTILY